MRFRRTFKEVYIRLAELEEDEQAIVCTVEYGGFLRSAVQFPLARELEALPDLKDECSLALRMRRRFGTHEQG